MSNKKKGCSEGYADIAATGGVSMSHQFQSKCKNYDCLWGE